MVEVPDDKKEAVGEAATYVDNRTKLRKAIGKLLDQLNTQIDANALIDRQTVALLDDLVRMSDPRYEI